MPTFSASALAIPMPATASTAAATAVLTSFFICTHSLLRILAFPISRASAYAAYELFQPVRFRRAEHLFRRAFFFHAAVVQIDDMARDLAGKLHLVRDEDHRAAFARQIADHLQHFAHQFR